jgi:Protein of unknown function DUF262
MSAYLETTHRNVIWIKRAAAANELELAPPFQRGPVWTDRQKSHLIDTILRGFPIPELYMQDLVAPDGKQSHIVVDGQQRILACLQFLEGQFELDATQNPEFADLTFDEFISELAVGLLHGVQNKKQSLDKWYRAYEKEFEQLEYVETVFTKVLGELSQIVPNINRTRWHKKSEFYTLFLVFASHEASLPLARDSRRLAAEKLTTFDQTELESVLADVWNAKKNRSSKNAKTVAK